jgi:hypothetical protein
MAMPDQQVSRGYSPELSLWLWNGLWACAACLGKAQPVARPLRNACTVGHSIATTPPPRSRTGKPTALPPALQAYNQACNVRDSAGAAATAGCAGATSFGGAFASACAAATAHALASIDTQACACDMSASSVDGWVEQYEAHFARVELQVEAHACANGTVVAAESEVRRTCMASTAAHVLAEARGLCTVRWGCMSALVLTRAVACLPLRCMCWPGCQRRRMQLLTLLGAL